jgi:hypothetical protein
MPVDLSSLLSLDAQEREVSIPVGSETVHVTIRELPYGVAKRLSFRYGSAYQAYEACKASVERLGKEGAAPLSPEEQDALASALADLWEAQRDCVRWGVVAHREADFLAGGLTIPFETAEAVFNGAPYRVASPRMLRLYQLAGGGRGGNEGTLIPDIAAAVLKIQRAEPEVTVTLIVPPSDPRQPPPVGGAAAASPLPPIVLPASLGGSE